MNQSRIKARCGAVILSACLLLEVATVAAQPASPPPGHDAHGHASPPSPPPPPQAHTPTPPSPAHAIPTPLNEHSRYGQPPRHWTNGEKAWVRHVTKCQRRYRSYNWRTDFYYMHPGKGRRCRL